ncbi:ComEC/Rec2 family competence protein [Nonlabens ponticola]|uniref:ComEC family competence protein n=1 Tax=Nonlabens ponticola TaxID=2496866 RepID=A0A3S9MWU6_9FLAO|nr:ComEC/Rec2 family competence protein [Nonlabens ponticola]AZQ43612.1 ComEC family competence protein [Nonlabens ponticola]
MRWLDYPLYRLLGFFVLGIISARFLEFDLLQLGAVSIVLFIAFLTSFFIFRFSVVSKWIFTLSSSLLFTVIGFCLYQIQTEVFPENHLSQLEQTSAEQLIDFTLTQQLATNQYNHRFYAKLHSVGGTQVSGSILVLFKKTDSVAVKVGSRLIAFDDINAASDGRNPGDFNYKEYLKSIDVYGQVYVDLPKILSVSSKTDLPWYVQLRNTLLEKLESSELKAQPRAMIEALILGQRQNVDPAVSRSFRDAGVIHILALSGLHVGIILLILRFATRWMHRLPYGRWLQAALLIVLLWCFAFLTGMSPSITRAVTMFSFVALGLAFKKKPSVFHSLTASALFLLVLDPRLLFQVGFQLSYTAVLGIVLLQPLFLSLFPKKRNFLYRLLINTFCVTLAAQLAVAPLSAFYFHQLPVSFIIGNMLLLPVLPIIIGLSILFFVTLLSNIPTSEFAVILNYIFETIIEVISVIGSWTSLIIKDIYLDSWQVVLIYIAMLGLALFIKPHVARSKKEQFILVKPNNMLHVSLVALILLIGVSLYDSMKDEEYFMVLHQSRASAITIANKDQAQLYCAAGNMESQRRANSIKRLSNVSFLQGKHIVIDSLPNLVSYGDRSILIIDESSVLGALDQVPEDAILLLQGSPKINLEELIMKVQPQIIISDGSNYPSDVKRWTATCEKMNVKFFNTYNDGAIDLLKL